MLLGIAFVVACAAFGWFLSLRFNLFDEGWHRLAFALLVGLLAGTWICLLVSWLVFSSLNWLGVTATIIVLLGAAYWLKESAPKNKTRTRREPFYKDKTVFAVVMLFFIAFTALNFKCVIEPNNDGDLVSVLNVWGDGPFHYGIITSFVYRDNFPPEYPVLDGAPLSYPFLMDFLSSILLYSGFSLRYSVIFANILMGFALFSFAFLLAKKISGKKAVALLALALFFVNGNFGVAYAAQDALQDPGALAAPATDYSHNEPAGLWFMNLTYSLFLPQRSILLGFSLAFLVLLLLHDVANNRFDKRRLLLAGVLAGLTPMAHAHSALAMGFVVVFLFLWKPRKEWLWFLVPAALLALPQLAWMFGQAAHGFAGIKIGWLDANADKSLAELALFWLENAWLVLVLGLIGWFVASKKTRLYYVPFAAMFVVGNLVRFQTWDWDNVKLLAYWFFATSVLAAMFIYKVYSIKSKKKTFSKIAKALAVLLFIFAIASGLLTLEWMAWGKNARYETYPVRDLVVAEWIQENTPPEAVFLTGDSPQSLPVSLAGRQGVIGFRGWLWSHGLDYGEAEQATREFYRSPNCAIVKKHGIDYVFLSPQEKMFSPNEKALEQAPFLEKVFDATSNGFRFRVFKTNC